MWSEVLNPDVVNNVLALTAGLVTGFYFERRATKKARRDADEAESRNRELRESIANLRAELVTRSQPSRGVATNVVPSEDGDIVSLALAFAQERQDASGRISPAALRNGLMVEGHSLVAVDAAIQELLNRKVLRRIGPDLEVRA